MNQLTINIKLLISCSLLLVSKIILATTTLPVQNGDIIFQTSLSSQSLAIQQATHSPYSHMGIIIFKGATPYVFEASKTVRYTPLKDWINRGKNHHYVIKRLKNNAQLLDTEALKKQADYFANRPYDLTFEWSDAKLYCSELVWKIYERAWHIQLAPLQTIADYDLTQTAVKIKLKERYGDNIPLAEPTISPVAIFNSPLLETLITP